MNLAVGVTAGASAQVGLLVDNPRPPGSTAEGATAPTSQSRANGNRCKRLDNVRHPMWPSTPARVRVLRFTRLRLGRGKGRGKFKAAQAWGPGLGGHPVIAGLVASNLTDLPTGVSTSSKETKALTQSIGAGKKHDRLARHRQTTNLTKAHPSNIAPRSIVAPGSYTLHVSWLHSE